MPRVSKEQNKIDMDNVISILTADPGLDVETIARRSGLSNQQVYKILRNLEEDGTVFGTTRLLDLVKAKRKRFIIFAKRSGEHASERTLKCALYSQAFLDLLAKDNIDIIPEDDYTCSGEFDMVTVINAASTLEANRYVDLLRAVSFGYFSTFSIVEVMFTTKRNSIRTPDIERFIEHVPKPPSD